MDKKQETFDKFVPADSSFSRYKHGLNESPKYSENKTYPCQEWMVINWDGSVNPCCWDYNGKHKSYFQNKFDDLKERYRY